MTNQDPATVEAVAPVAWMYERAARTMISSKPSARLDKPKIP